MSHEHGGPLSLPIVSNGAAKAAEPSDPFEPTAVRLNTPGYDGLAAMGRAFIEEFARMGWSRQRIRRMFEVRQFAAPRSVMEQRGPAFVDALIEDVLGPDAESNDSIPPREEA